MSKVYISFKAYEQLKSELVKEGYELAVLRPNSAVSEPVSAHPDIFMTKLGTLPKSPVFHGDSELLRPEYPGDVLYNAAVLGDFIICNQKHVSKELLYAVKSQNPGLKIINVKQGYTKCNLVTVDDGHVITEDEGIAAALEKVTEIECLLVKPGEVGLEGYPRGFIGGASGRIGNTIWFNGDITRHSDFEKIKTFIENCGLVIKWIPEVPLMDIGSIIEEY